MVERRTLAPDVGGSTPSPSANFVMKLTDLRKALSREHRLTKLPFYRELTRLGCGFFRCAYRIGDWVIKRSAEVAGQADEWPRWKQRRAAKELNVSLARTYRVGRWEIQRYYEPMTAQEFFSTPLVDTGWSEIDLQPANVHRDPNGRIIVFDW